MRLKQRVENLEKELEETQQTLEFALEHGKDAIDVWLNYNMRCYCAHYYICARYIKNGKVCETSKEIPYQLDRKSISVEKNPDGTCFIKGKTLQGKDVYFQLKKDTGEIIDITEVKEHFENQEKITEHLENSAKGLADAVIGLFGKKDTPKAEKARKPRTQKTEKVDEPKQETKTEKKSNKKGDK